MGHTRLGELPRTRKWQEVVGLIACDASIDQIAMATLNAAERGLNLATEDRALVETVWLLTQLPLAAKATTQEGFVAQLRIAGLNVSDAPGLMEIAGCFSDAVDAYLSNNNGRSDLGEMAQMAATETLQSVVAARAQGLFGTHPRDVQKAIAELNTKKNFSQFTRRFYARVTERCLEYFLSRAMSLHVGEGRRFATLAQRSAFSEAIGLHCKEASRIVEEFAGGWYSKTNFEKGGITREDARGFAHIAMRKIADELTAGAVAHAQ